MKYYNIDAEVEEKITGSRNGVYSVEIKEKYSFSSLEDKKIWKDYCTQNRKNRSRVLWNDYIQFNPTLLSNPITFFPIGKKIRQLDFMAYCPYEHGIQFLVTQKVYDIISKYRLPTHNKVPAKIDAFEQNYYLIGFPMLEKFNFDFNKSIFVNYSEGNKVIFKNEEHYNQLQDTSAYIVPEIILLKKELNFDIIKTFKGIFFSSTIIEEFQKENISGYKIIEGILEN